MKRALLAAALFAGLGLAVASAALASARAAPSAPAGAKGGRLPPGQAAGERDVQATLPQSKAPVWAVLRRTHIGEDPIKGIYTAAFPPEVRGMDRKPVVLSGFVLPLDAEARSRHFLLSKYTPVCFFCPPGEPNEVVEVFSRAGVPVTDRLVQVSGRFGLANDGEKGLFFRIDDAQVR